MGAALNFVVLLVNGDAFFVLIDVIDCARRALAHVQLRRLSKRPCISSASSQRRSSERLSRNCAWLRPGVRSGILARARTALTKPYASVVGPLCSLIASAIDSSTSA